MGQDQVPIMYRRGGRFSSTLLWPVIDYISVMTGHIRLVNPPPQFSRLGTQCPTTCFSVYMLGCLLVWLLYMFWWWRVFLFYSFLASMLRACFLRETFHKPVRLYMGSYGLSDQDSVNWSTWRWSWLSELVNLTLIMTQWIGQLDVDHDSVNWSTWRWSWLSELVNLTLIMTQWTGQLDVDHDSVHWSTWCSSCWHSKLIAVLPTPSSYSNTCLSRYCQLIAITTHGYYLWLFKYMEMMLLHYNTNYCKSYHFFMASKGIIQSTCSINISDEATLACTLKLRIFECCGEWSVSDDVVCVATLYKWVVGFSYFIHSATVLVASIEACATIIPSLKNNRNVHVEFNNYVYTLWEQGVWLRDIYSKKSLYGSQDHNLRRH